MVLDLFMYIYVHTCTVYLVSTIDRGQCTYPHSVGMYDLPVETWRPTGRRVVDRLSRFFVGGGPELSDISYITQPKDFEVCEFNMGVMGSGNGM